MLGNKTLIAEHTDINDEAQTVTVGTREPVTNTTSNRPGGGAQTGHDAFGAILWLSIATAIGLVGAIVIRWFMREKKK